MRDARRPAAMVCLDQIVCEERIAIRRWSPHLGDACASGRAVKDRALHHLTPSLLLRSSSSTAPGRSLCGRIRSRPHAGWIERLTTGTGPASPPSGQHLTPDAEHELPPGPVMSGSGARAVASGVLVWPEPALPWKGQLTRSQGRLMPIQHPKWSGTSPRLFGPERSRGESRGGRS